MSHDWGKIVSAPDNRLSQLRSLRSELISSSNEMRELARLQSGSVSLQIAAEHLDQAIKEITARIASATDKD